MEILIESLVETARLLPLLAAIYFFIGFLEYRYGDRINHMIARIGGWAPVAGALFGCIPQCGLSVVASALYVKRLISVGTLLAVFLSTSDEAVPVLLSIPDKLNIVGLLIVIKVIVAVIAGVTVDHIISIPGGGGAAGKGLPASLCDSAVDGHPGCCSHGLQGKNSRFKALVVHPLLHTAKIFLFLLSLTVIFDYLVAKAGPREIASALLSGSVFQPVLTAVIGLIPNCFTSVLMVELFDKGAIGFGSMVAGLSAGTGLGLLVLIKENKDFRDTLRVVGMLLGISAAAGMIVRFICAYR